MEIDPRYLRPTDVDELRADPSRAMAELGWKPKVTFFELATGMVESDLAQVGLSIEEARERAASLS